jgi:hypothetical protein
MAQGDEGIDIYYNRGDGRFNRERILRFPAVYGSVFFEITDFNHDGHWDIVYVNGDNGDYSPVLKPYHGVRLFLNNGKNEFTEDYFYPIHGAYKALVRDFDSDGDFDIAVVAFFPDFFNHPEKSFLYLENISRPDTIEFKASTFPEAGMGRWITMEAADVDSDGDEDIMLGSFTGMDITGDKSRQLIEQYVKESPAFIILKNEARTIFRPL